MSDSQIRSPVLLQRVHTDLPSGTHLGIIWSFSLGSPPLSSYVRHTYIGVKDFGEEEAFWGRGGEVFRENQFDPELAAFGWGNYIWGTSPHRYILPIR